MKKIMLAFFMMVIATIAAASSNSSPGLYYGQVPTAAQWNSYFSTKLDYTPGSANTLPYWDSSGNLLNAAVSGDCTSLANVFTCLTLNGSSFAAPSPIGNITPNTGRFTTVGIGQVPGNALLGLAAGTTSVPQIIFTPGVVTTSPVAGAVEFDGYVNYFTPVTSNRAVSLSEHFVNNSAAQTGTNGSSAQPWFVTTLTNGQITLPATTTYEFEGVLIISETGTTSHTIAIGMGGTATFTAIGYVADVTTNATGLGTLTAKSTEFIQTASSTVVTGAITTAQYTVIEVRGTMRVNAAGTVIPQFTFSSSPGAAPTIALGTYFRMKALGTNTVTNIGNWN